MRTPKAREADLILGLFDRRGASPEPETGPDAEVIDFLPFFLARLARRSGVAPDPA